MPDFKPTPNFASPLPSPFAALSPGGCSWGWWHIPGLPHLPLMVSLSGQQWVCRGVWAPYLSPASQAPALPPTRLPCRLSHCALCRLPAPSSLLESRGGWERDGRWAEDSQSVQSQAGPRSPTRALPAWQCPGAVPRWSEGSRRPGRVSLGFAPAGRLNGTVVG